MQWSFIINAVLSITLLLAGAPVALAQPRLRAVRPSAGGALALHVDKRRESELADLAKLARDASAVENLTRPPLKASKTPRPVPTFSGKKSTPLPGKPITQTQRHTLGNATSQALSTVHPLAVKARSGEDLLRKWSANHTATHVNRRQGLHAGMKNLLNRTTGLSAAAMNREIPGYHSAKTVLQGAQVLEHWSALHATVVREPQAAASTRKEVSTTPALRGHKEMVSKANEVRATTTSDATHKVLKNLRMPATHSQGHVEEQRQLHLPSTETASEGLHALEAWKASQRLPLEKALASSTHYASTLGATKSTSLHSISDDLKALHSTMHELESSTAHDAMRRFRDEDTTVRMRASSDRVHQPEEASLSNKVVEGVHALETWSTIHRSDRHELIYDASLKGASVAQNHVQQMSVVGVSTSTRSHSISADLTDLNSTMHDLESSAEHDAMRKFRGGITTEHTDIPLEGIDNAMGGPPPETVWKGIHALKQWSKVKAAHQHRFLSDEPILDHHFVGSPSRHSSDFGISESTSSHSISADRRDLHSTMHDLETSAAHSSMRKFRTGIAAANSNAPFDRADKSVGRPPSASIQKGIHALDQWSKVRRAQQHELVSDVLTNEHHFIGKPSDLASDVGTSNPKASHPVSDDRKDLHSTMHDLESSAAHDAMLRFHDGVAMDHIKIPLHRVHDLAGFPSSATVLEGKNFLDHWTKDHTPEKHGPVRIVMSNAALSQPQPAHENLPLSKSIGVGLKDVKEAERQSRQSDIHAAMHKLGAKAPEVVSTGQASMPPADVVSKGEITLERWAKTHPLA